MEEIKTCPICGSKGDIYSRHMAWNEQSIRDENGVWKFDYIEFGVERWVADCSECDCVVGEFFSSRESAIKAWNKRA